MKNLLKMFPIKFSNHREYENKVIEPIVSFCLSKNNNINYKDVVLALVPLLVEYKNTIIIEDVELFKEELCLLLKN